MILVIGALPEEVSTVIGAMKVSDEHDHGGLKFFEGVLGQTRMLVVCCGMGKVNASVATTIGITVLGATSVINIGIAGGIGRGVKPYDVVVATLTKQHDMVVVNAEEDKDFSQAIFPELKGEGWPTDHDLSQRLADACRQLGVQPLCGTVISGDQFVADTVKAKKLAITHDALAVDMESAAIAQVCYILGVPYAILRSISDNADDSAEAVVNDNASVTAAASCDILIKAFE